MIQKQHLLWKEEDYTYPVYGSFRPNLMTYLHETGENRPAVIVVPGGGYRFVSPSEGERVAKAFYEKGYQAFVLTYTTNVIKEKPLGLQPLKDLSKAVQFIRKQAGAFAVDRERVALCGFSAGGHLCGSLAVHYGLPELADSEHEKKVSNRPDAVILSYPVITSGPFSHEDSFVRLLGQEVSSDQLENMSLEKQVKPDTPPVFLWHTATDGLVPVENAYLFADACQKQGVPFELHVFGNGGHGLSLANDDWASGVDPGDYTFAHYYESLSYARQNGIDLPELASLPEEMDIREAVQAERAGHNRQADPGIAMWFELAGQWLGKVLK